LTVEGHPRTLSGPSPDPSLTTPLRLPSASVDQAVAVKPEERAVAARDKGVGGDPCRVLNRSVYGR
jgi:hypothetical protein